MDKIVLQGMKFYGYHGVFPEETKLGQRFQVDLELQLSLKQAGETDELAHTVNYGEVFERTKHIVEGKPFKLVEALAEQIAKDILSFDKRIETVKVRVIKPDPPIPGHYDFVSVDIERNRGFYE